MKLLKTFKIAEIREVRKADGTTELHVGGVCTSEMTDQGNEECDYDDTKPLYEAWSARKFAATTAAGQEPSLGNIRVQHTMEVGGKVVAIEYRDDDKCIFIDTVPVDDAMADKLRKGFYTGFSQGGSYVYRRCKACNSDMGEDPQNFKCPKCSKYVIVRYACDPSEVSYVDNPCNEQATFTYVKADGSKQVRKFRGSAQPAAPVHDFPLRVVARTTKVGGKVKRPALKSLYHIGYAASILDDIRYLRNCTASEGEYEGDDRDVKISEGLQALLEDGVDILKLIVEDETSELIAATKAATTKGAGMKDNLFKAARKGMKAILQKAVANNESLAALHTEMVEETQSQLEAHKAIQEDADCKSLHPHAKKMYGHCKAVLDIHKKLAKQYTQSAKDAQAQIDALEAEDVELAKAESTAAPAVAKAAPAPAAPAATADPANPAPAADPTTQVQSTLDGVLQKSLQDAIARVTGSEDFTKSVDGAVHQMLLNGLANKTVPTNTKIAGPQLVHKGSNAPAPAGDIDLASVPLDLQEFVTMEGEE